jgi:hypothetical protein
MAGRKGVASGSLAMVLAVLLAGVACVSGCGDAGEQQAFVDNCIRTMSARYQTEVVARDAGGAGLAALLLQSPADEVDYADEIDSALDHLRAGYAAMDEYVRSGCEDVGKGQQASAFFTELVEANSQALVLAIGVQSAPDADARTIAAEYVKSLGASEKALRACEELIGDVSARSVEQRREDMVSVRLEIEDGLVPATEQYAATCRELLGYTQEHDPGDVAGVRAYAGAASTELKIIEEALGQT